jgi:hypothetical protein
LRLQLIERGGFSQPRNHRVEITVFAAHFVQPSQQRIAVG